MNDRLFKKTRERVTKCCVRYHMVEYNNEHVIIMIVGVLTTATMYYVFVFMC